MDPLTAGSAAMTLGQGGISFLGFVRDHLSRGDVIAAMFSSDAVRVEGDKRISVKRLAVGDMTGGWVYTVEPLEGFTFVAFAVHPAAEILFEQLQGAPNPTVEFFRWVAPRRSGQVENVGWGGPNLVVAFIVVGYRPKALVQYFEQGPIRD